MINHSFLSSKKLNGKNLDGAKMPNVQLFQLLKCEDLLCVSQFSCCFGLLASQNKQREDITFGSKIKMSFFIFIIYKLNLHGAQGELMFSLHV